MSKLHEATLELIAAVRDLDPFNGGAQKCAEKRLSAAIRTAEAALADELVEAAK